MAKKTAPVSVSVSASASAPVSAKPQSVVVIRGGMAIAEDVSTLPTGITGLIEIDHAVPLANRGLVPDCVRVFSVDFYIPKGMIYFMDLERFVEEDPKWGPVYKKMKKRLFDVSSFERDNWEEIRAQRVDGHGAGALIIQGLLKMYAALIGREFDLARDASIQKARVPEKKGKHVGTVRVSLLNDLLVALDEMAPDEIGFACGLLGGTGPSVSAVLGDVLADLNFNVVRVHLLSLPEAVMVNNSVPAEVADKIQVVLDLLSPMAVYVGLGWEGVFWQFLHSNLRTIGERFSNLTSKKLQTGAAAIWSIIGVPYRPDLPLRWMLGLSATSTITVAEARERLQNAIKNKVLSVTIYTTDGMQPQRMLRLKVESPKALKMRHWKLLIPALAKASTEVIRLPVVQSVPGSGFLGMGTKMETVELPVGSSPDYDKVLARAGLDHTRLNQEIGVWALTVIEQRLLDRFDANSFVEVFGDAHQKGLLETNFVVYVIEILNAMFFDGVRSLFPATPVVSDTPLAYFMMTQLSASPRALADILCGYYAKVDRTREESAAIARAEEERIAATQERVLRLLGQLDAQQLAAAAEKDVN